MGQLTYRIREGSVIEMNQLSEGNILIYVKVGGPCLGHSGCGCASFAGRASLTSPSPVPTRKISLFVILFVILNLLQLIPE